MEKLLGILESEIPFGGYGRRITPAECARLREQGVACKESYIVVRAAVDTPRLGYLYEPAYTLAERFAPLDNTANGLREAARAYIQASSFFGVNWQLAVQYLSQVASGWPSLWDGTMTASQRYQIALMRYGDQLFGQNSYCEAYQQYQLAQSIGNLDDESAKYANQAYRQCYPPTEVPTDTPAVPVDTVAPPADTPPTAPYNASRPLLGLGVDFLAAPAGNRGVDRKPGCDLTVGVARRGAHAQAG